MSEPFIGELKIISWNFPPKGWAFASGQLLAINQNQALFSILGTTFGGNGQTNFALPNLQGRIPMHVGGTSGIVLGQAGGSTSVTLNVQQLGSHNHSLMADKSAAGGTNSSNTPDPANGKVLGASAGLTGQPAHPFAANMYSTAGLGGTLNAGCISNTGGGQAHDNMSPYLVLNVIIALQGIFPSRN
jgi:microcystin-dependent protein